MKRYLRFGEIPPGEKSVNYLKMSGKEKDQFNLILEDSPEEAFDLIGNDQKEAGVSVFEIGTDGFPIFENLKQAASFCCRAGELPAFEVTGQEVGKGQDGEPLICGVKKIKRRRISAQKAVEHVRRFMCSHFSDIKPGEPSEDPLGFFHFRKSEKINIYTGERVESFAAYGDEWAALPDRDIYVVSGWEYSAPVQGFDTRLGRL